MSATVSNIVMTIRQPLINTVLVTSRSIPGVKKYNEKETEGLVDKHGKRKPESRMTELEKLRAENKLLAARNKRLETENAVLKKLEEIERRWH